jgi:putative phosphoesterase
MDSRAASFTIAIVADTHVPDRVNELHPGLMPALKAARIDHIFHAGDACVNRVLDELSQVAPVSVVRGNRDFLLKPLPPMSLTMNISGVNLVLSHGHGSFITYWLDKAQHVVEGGYRFERYWRRLLKKWPDANAFIYGHTHYPENCWIDRRLFLNPGSASFGIKRLNHPPSFGLLHIHPDRRLEAEICPLTGWHVDQGRWMRRA